MVDDNNKNTSSFEDEFNFLSDQDLENVDEAAEAAPNSLPKIAPTKTIGTFSALFKSKQIVMLTGIIILGLLSIMFLGKRSTPLNNKLHIPETNSPTKLDLINNTSTTSNTQDPATPVNQADKPLAKIDKLEPASPSNEEKSRDEIALLFNPNDSDKTNKHKSIDTNPPSDDSSTNINKLTPSHSTTNATSTPIAPPANNNVVSSTSEKIDTEMKKSISSVTKELSQQFNNIQQLKSTLKDISITLSKLNQSISAIDGKVMNLTETVKGLSNDVANVRQIIAEEDLDLASKAQATAAERPSLTYKAPEYVVHAIIPGRAWLKSVSGQIITVAEGDVVGDYGTVAVIDAANNIVRTSSGVAFR